MPERGLEVDELDAMDRILDGCGSDYHERNQKSCGSVVAQTRVDVLRVELA